jgi:glutathione synthase/RimK-type ligase-like ATP-grasp enzyme
MAASRAVILPYKMGSQSAKVLSNNLTRLLNLRVRRVRADGAYRAKVRSLVINYGHSSGLLRGNVGRYLNAPAACQKSGNKLSAFQAFKAAGLSCPEWTTDRAAASVWLAGGHTVVCRTVLNGHSGRGIVLSSRDSGHDLVHAPLYVKYKKKRKEFRVHVFKERVIDVAEKRRRRVEVRPPHFDGSIRNLANGWVFCRDSIVRPRDLDGLAVAACRATGLDFGAVDIIWNEKEDKCFLLEVNTAPGLQGTTLTNYSNAIYQWIRSQ